MEIRFIPLTIVFETQKEYRLSILGIQWKGGIMAIGFSLKRNKRPDRYEWELNMFFYKIRKSVVVKTIMHPYQLICNYCGNPIWKHNCYCPNCLDNLSYDEVTRVPEYSEEEEKRSIEWRKKYDKSFIYK
jgi:hypothetical protein